MYKIIYLLLPLFLLTACVSPPLYAKFDDGKILQGSGMNGQFSMRDIDGFSCKGSYPLIFINPTFEMPIECNNGQKGTILMTMNSPDYETGFGRGKLENNTRFNVIFGGLTKRQTLPAALNMGLPKEQKKR